MTQAMPSEERRKHWRYPCFGEAWVRTRGADVLLEARLADISLGGCYLDTMNPFPSETEMELEFSLGGRSVLAQGRVRASRQGFGMGVAFTEITGTELTKLQELIDSLAGSYPLEPNPGAKARDPADAVASAAPRKSHFGSEPNMLDPLELLLEVLERKFLITRTEHEELTHRIEAAHLANKERTILV